MYRFHEQLRIPEEIVKQFYLTRDSWSVELLPDYEATGKKAPKYRPVHWHDWMKANTKPWRPPTFKEFDPSKWYDKGLIEYERGND